MVNKGDPLAALYSPDLVVTIQNLLDARKPRTTGPGGERPRPAGLWGVEAEQIEEILKAGKPVTHLTIRSPIDGHVVKKYSAEGQYVDEGGPLFDVADLTTVWVQAQLYEEDLAFLPAGGHDPKTGLPARPAAGRGDDPRPAGGDVRRQAVVRVPARRSGEPDPDRAVRAGRTRTTNCGPA